MCVGVRIAIRKMLGSCLERVGLLSWDAGNGSVKPHEVLLL